MIEELLNIKLTEKIVVELLGTEKGSEICIKHSFDESTFWLLLLDIKDKGLNRVKRALLKEYTQEKDSNLQNEDTVNIDLGSRVLKPNFSEDDRVYFEQAIDIINFLNGEIDQKAKQYETYLVSLKCKLDVCKKLENSLFTTTHKIIPTEQEYTELVNKLKNQDETLVAKEVLRQYEETGGQDTGSILEEIDFKNKKNNDFYKQLSEDLRNFVEKEKDDKLKRKAENLDKEKTEIFEESNIIEPENDEFTENSTEQKKKNLKLRMKLSVIDYNIKMKMVLSKNRNWQILEKDLAQQR